MSPNLRFEFVPGFFEHDGHPTGPEGGFRATTLPALGILQQDYPDQTSTVGDQDPQWQRLEKHLAVLNAGPKDCPHKVFFVTRHGEGVHNVKEREVGRHEWEAHWARLPGDEKTTWLDARLTSKGKQQAQDLRSFWLHASQVDKVPLPQTIYSSPLIRALQTTSLAFQDIPELKFKPIIKESLREITGVHTCDKRSSKSSIEAEFPEYQVESEMTEEDTRWKVDRRETLTERVEVINDFLAKVFSEDPSTFVSLTTHSGAIRALYQAIGHPDVWVAAGAVVPIVIRENS
ncbi:hypothetical protein CB0940_07286 [Cercospora beticola]|uniref:Phosphoglycerate mutase n=1 Tax=Cercospora beticola TaxID=122368 RepID=A0A2G5H948_CERBT|nr:hypothetical protein CB0940_07286 [Cercospora beticola]PIA89057.1 hypothetical protein CB0940_07286 [Cercospora beticola]WPB03224.1 hypothetical protein RHO25_007861 [Cercospora beticola]